MSEPRDDRDRRDGVPGSGAVVERVRAHARECDECSTRPLELGAVSALFARAVEPVPASSLRDRVMAAAVPLLGRNAALAYRRRVVSGVALSLAPFPLLVFFNLYMLREAFALLSSWLPLGFAAWLIVGYAAMLLLLCALTYASLPVLIARARAGATDARTPLASGAYV